MSKTNCDESLDMNAGVTPILKQMAILRAQHLHAAERLATAIRSLYPGEIGFKACVRCPHLQMDKHRPHADQGFGRTEISWECGQIIQEVRVARQLADREGVMPEEKEGAQGIEGFGELLTKMAEARKKFDEEHGDMELPHEFKYPMEVSKISVRRMPPGKDAGMLVKVRPVNDEKTYLGIYLGDMGREIMLLVGVKNR